MTAKKFILLITYAIIFFSSQCFFLANWKIITGQADQLYYGLYILVFLQAIIFLSKRHIKLYFSNIVIAIFLISFPCCITIIVNNESLLKEIPYFLFPMALLLYFSFVLFRLSERSLINCLMFFGICVCIIQVVQQLFPSIAVFGIGLMYTDEVGSSSIEDLVSNRNGLYRYLFPTLQISVFCMCYWWSKLFDKIKTYQIIMFVIFAVSVYLYLTRQMIFASIFTLSLSSVLFKLQKKETNRFVPFILIIAVACFFTIFFGEMVQETKEGGISFDYRIMSYRFYWAKIVDNPLSFLFGNGHPKSMEMWQDMHMHTSDIGFVGEVYHKGIFFLLLYLILFYKFIFKYRKEIPFYIRLYVICSFIPSVMGFPYRSGLEFVLWAIVIYIAEIHIQEARIEKIRLIQKKVND